MKQRPKSTVHAVSCPDAIAKGKVCTHAVTIKQLLDWGIDCEIVLDHMRWPGQPRHLAVHQAWLAGHVQICTLDPHTTGLPWTIRRAIAPEHITAVLSMKRRERDAA